MNEILSAKRIIREQRFNVSFPSEKFTNDPALVEKMNGEELAVQGVIDLILITRDGKIKLYDYKTDRLTKNELEAKYTQRITSRIIGNYVSLLFLGKDIRQIKNKHNSGIVLTYRQF